MCVFERELLFTVRVAHSFSLVLGIVRVLPWGAAKHQLALPPDWMGGDLLVNIECSFVPLRQGI